MKIYFNDTNIDLPINDNSYRYRAIKGENNLTLYYSLAEHVEIPLGAYCEFEGERYELSDPENFKMLNSRNFEYTLVLESSQSALKKYKFKDTTSRKLKFSLTGKPDLHLKMLVDNLNQRESGWAIGECLDMSEKVISYNHAWCIDALNQIADAFDTEWEIVGKTISLRKVEYNKDNPLKLSYGRGNGFKSGIGRHNDGDRPVEILYVQGGSRNINASKYGSQELLLPKDQTLEYEGRKYISDADGFSIRRADKELLTHAEDSIDLSNIYPSRVGEISEVTVADAKNHNYDFSDSSIPDDLDYSKCVIEGESLTVIFQSGILTGKEFGVKYIHEGRKFEIVSEEKDGRTMPDEIFSPKVGDKYAVFGMAMPDNYVCDNENKSGASWDLFREAAKSLYEHESQRFTFTGELDGIWAKKDWLNIGGKIKLGGYILFSDNQFQPDGVKIRIVGIKDFVNNPHSPVIELSNSVVGSSIRNELIKIKTNEVTAENLHKEAIQFTKRRFRDSAETMAMIQEAALNNFSKSISPITIKTMAMLIGDESLQFRFVDNMQNPHKVNHNVTFDKERKILTSERGIIQHMTLGISSLSPNHKTSEYHFWQLDEFNSPPLAEAKKTYYLYAKVGRDDQSGSFILSEKAIAMQEVDGYYHLLVGILNSELDGERSYVDLFGFTEILPGRITTDKIISSDGGTYFDLANSEIGGNITFKSRSGETKPVNSIEDDVENVNEKIDNMQVGGRNLILDSLNGTDYISTLDKQATYTKVDDYIQVDVKKGEERSVYFTVDPTNCPRLAEKLKLNNSSYTFAVDYISVDPVIIAIGNNHKYEKEFPASPNAWNRAFVTATIGEVWDGGYPLVMIYPKKKGEVSYKVRKFKLEEGTIKTTWMLAPEDEARLAKKYADGRMTEAEKRAYEKAKGLVDDIQVGGDNLLSRDCLTDFYGDVKYNYDDNSYDIIFKNSQPATRIEEGFGVMEKGETYTLSGYAFVEGKPAQFEDLWVKKPNEFHADCGEIHIKPNGYFWYTMTANQDSDFHRSFLWEFRLEVEPDAYLVRFVDLVLVRGNVPVHGAKSSKDASYLEEALKQTTEVKGGLILTSTVGVRNSSDVVNSYMSGSSDNEVAFAAGVENFGKTNETQKAVIRKNGDANFKNITIEGGQIKQGVKLGFFDLTNYGLVLNEYEEKTINGHKLFINSRGYRYERRNNGQLPDSVIQIGHGSRGEAIGIETEPSAASPNGEEAVGLALAVTGNNGKVGKAIDIDKGCINGFRLRYERISESTTVGGGGGFVRCAKDNITIRLSGHCETGQVIYISAGWKRRIKVATSDGSKFADGKTEKYIYGSAFHMFIYDSTDKVWFVNYQIDYDLYSDIYKLINAKPENPGL